MKDFARGAFATVMLLCLVSFYIALRRPSVDELFVRMKDATDDYIGATGGARVGPFPWQPRDHRPDPPAAS